METLFRLLLVRPAEALQPGQDAIVAAQAALDRVVALACSLAAPRSTAAAALARRSQLCHVNKAAVLLLSGAVSDCGTVLLAYTGKAAYSIPAYSDRQPGSSRTRQRAALLALTGTGCGVGHPR
jgi:hypothetical protein